MPDTPKNTQAQRTTARLVSSARTHAAAAPSPARLERIAERTKADSIWRSQ